MGAESVNSTSGTLYPGTAGGTFVFHGNACTDVVDRDGFLGNEEDSCDAGDVQVGVDPQPPPPTISVNVVNQDDALNTTPVQDTSPTPIVLWRLTDLDFRQGDTSAFGTDAPWY